MTARENALQNVSEILGTECEIINPVLECDNPLKCLGENIKLLAEADYIYFVDGWSLARGCLVEKICAALYGAVDLGTSNIMKMGRGDMI